MSRKPTSRPKDHVMPYHFPLRPDGEPVPPDGPVACEGCPAPESDDPCCNAPDDCTLAAGPSRG